MKNEGKTGIKDPSTIGEECFLGIMLLGIITTEYKMRKIIKIVA